MVLIRFFDYKKVKHWSIDGRSTEFICYICNSKHGYMKKNMLISLFFLFFSTLFSFAGQIGKATFYSHRMKGHHTTDGGKYQPDSLTCAHRTLPFGTLLRVRNPANNKEVIVRVTDRGPHRRNVLIDLSYSAARQLDMIRQGIASVEITTIESLPSWKFALPQDSIVALNNNVYNR